MGKLDLVFVDEIFCNFHPESAIFFNFELNTQNFSYLSYILKTAMLKSKKTNCPVVARRILGFFVGPACTVVISF